MTRPLLSLLATLALAACASPGSSDADGGTTSDGSTPDAGAVVEGRPVSASDFCAELTTIVCAADDACCGVDIASAADEEVSCETYQLGECEDTLLPLLEDPRTGYVPERGGAYLDTLRAQADGCFEEPPLLEDFEAVFAGTGIAEADCTPASVSERAQLRISDLSCEDGLACHLYRRSDGSPMGVCEPREDSACSHALDCGAGQWCNLPDGWEPGRWGSCQPLKASGWGCSSDLECQTRFCDRTRVCAEPLEERYCSALSYEGAVESHRPIGHWRLGDVGSPSAADRGPHGLLGTYEGSPTPVEGAIAGDADGALGIDGPGDGVLLPDIADLRTDDALSLEIWFRRAENSPMGPLFEFRNGTRGVHVWYNADDRTVHANLEDTEGAPHEIRPTEPVLAPDVWHHVVLTYDGERARLFVDGERVGQVDGVFSPRTDGPVNVGMHVDDERHLIGAIDEVAIYDRALSASEIRRHHATGTEGPPPQRFVLLRWLR